MACLTKGTALSVETIPAAVPNWNQYNEWNARHPGLSELWLKKLIHWLFEERLVTPAARISIMVAVILI